MVPTFPSWSPYFKIVTVGQRNLYNVGANREIELLRSLTGAIKRVPDRDSIVPRSLIARAQHRYTQSALRHEISDRHFFGLHISVKDVRHNRQYLARV
jgi:hypothetical protein